MHDAQSNVGEVTGNLFYRLRYLLCLVVLSVLQYGIVAPSIQFVMLTFFADNHGGGNCELTPSSDPCRRAAADAAVYRGVSMGVAGILQWICALLLGSYSDTKGRKPFFRAKVNISVTPIAALAYHVLFGGTLWLYLVVAPLYDAFDINGVFLGYMTDVVAEPKLRINAYGIVSGVFLGSIGLVLTVAGSIPANIAVYVALLACAAKVVYIYTIFPETSHGAKLEAPLPSVQEVFSGVHELFFRNSFITNMALILIISGLSAAGIGTIAPSYFTAYLGVDKKEGVQFVLVAGTSVALALVLLLHPLCKFLGEVGAMRVSLTASVIFPVALLLFTELWKLYVLIFALAGLMFLSFPIISTIKSNLVNQDEQGLLQGALASIRVLAETVSYFFFGWFYHHITRGGKAERSSAFSPFLIIAALAAGALLIACRLPAQPPLPSNHKDDLESATASQSILPLSHTSYSSA